MKQQKTLKYCSNNIDFNTIENIVFSEYEDTSWEYKEWLKENLEKDGWNWFKYEELNRISFLISVLNLVKKEKINFWDENDWNRKLIVRGRELEKYINKHFLNDSIEWENNKSDKWKEELVNKLSIELLKIEKILEEKTEFYEKSKFFVLDTENKIGMVLWGGSVSWFAHLWILKVLAQNNIPVHVLSGISMWSIVWSYLSMIVWDDGQIDEESLAFLTEVSKDIKYIDDFIEEIDWKKYIKTSDIIANYLKERWKTSSKVPFDIQVRLVEWDKYTDWIMLESPEWTELSKIIQKAKASSTQLKIFPELSPIDIDWKEYVDDLTAPWYSVTQQVKSMRGKHKPSLIISFPVSSADLSSHLRSFKFNTVDKYKDFKDMWDITIEPYEWWRLLMTNAFYNISAKWFKIPAQNKEELWIFKWEIPISKYIDLWEKAWEREIWDILKRLWLVRFEEKNN